MLHVEVVFSLLSCQRQLLAVVTLLHLVNQIIVLYQMGLRPRVLKFGCLRIYPWIRGFSMRLTGAMFMVLVA